MLFTAVSPLARAPTLWTNIIPPLSPVHASPRTGLFPDLMGPWRLQTAVARSWVVAYTLDAVDVREVELQHPKASANPFAR